MLFVKKSMKNSNKKAIFLDRDGTLNYDSNFAYKTEDVIVLPWVKVWLELFKKLWYLLIVITNQSGVARWYYTIEDAEKFNAELEKQLWIVFNEIYICPHHPQDNCTCRKPKLENILKAKKKYNLDLSQSYFIGDRDLDVLCGINAECTTVYIKNGIHEYTSDVNPDYIVESLEEFAQMLYIKHQK